MLAAKKVGNCNDKKRTTKQFTTGTFYDCNVREPFCPRCASRVNAKVYKKL